MIYPTALSFGREVYWGRKAKISLFDLLSSVTMCLGEFVSNLASQRSLIELTNRV